MLRKVKGGETQQLLNKNIYLFKIKILFATVALTWSTILDN